MSLGLQVGNAVVLLRRRGLGVMEVGIPQWPALTVVDRILLDKVAPLARELDAFAQPGHLHQLLVNQVLQVAVGRRQFEA